MIVSIIACGGIGYYVGTQFSSKKSVAMMFGLMSAIGIMMVEMLIYIIRAIKMENAYEKKISPKEEAKRQSQSASLQTANRKYSLKNKESIDALSDDEVDVLFLPVVEEQKLLSSKKND